MSVDELIVDMKERKVLGKGLAALRSEGQLPAVLHNHGQTSIHLMGDYSQVKKVYDKAGRHHPVFIQMGNKKQMALIKDADFEPTKQRLRHIVFQSIKQGEKTTAEIPVVFTEGVSIPAERSSLLVLRSLDFVEVEALPKDLPDQLEVDPSSLVEVGDTLTVADIKVPNGVTILTDSEHGIASVEMPKDQIAEADAAAANLAEDAEAPAADEVPSDQGGDEQPTDADAPAEDEEK